MNHVLIPKEQFQKFHAVEREEWSRTVGQRSTQLAFNYGLAELVSLGFTPEKLTGAKLFIDVLLNLSQVAAPSLDEKYPAQPLLEPGDKVPVVAQDT